jgi:CRISPR/Cas system-associated exonuclease Cas4 (RecB family)
MDRASDTTRLAWQLRHLTTLHAVFGQALHACARDCAVAVRDGGSLPTAEELAGRVRAALRAACAASLRREAFLADPKHSLMLHSVFYAGRFDREEVEAVRAKLEPCIEHLLGSTVWAAAGALPAGGVEVVDLLDAVELRGLTVYAAPDLVLSGSEHSCTIIDWKTGRRGADDGVQAQLALYAWYVQRRLGLTFREGAWTGKAIYLQEGEEEQITFTQLDLIRAEHRILESAEAMRRYLRDQAAGRPLERQAFPLVAPAFRFRCRRCRFFKLCESELLACGGMTDPAAGDVIRG